jgi:membrane associated rhomboid family serine protease
MLIPIGDVAPRKSFPWMNWAILLANAALFAWLAWVRPGYADVVRGYGMVPEEGRPLTFLTSMFLHAGVIHLLGNLLFLWIAGDNVEDRFGHFTYPLFYVSCGIAGGLTHFLVATGAERAIPCIGASGAISGVIGAYLVLVPGSRIKFLFWFILPIATFTIPSWLAILAWLATQGVMAWRQVQGLPMGIAVWAHLGGFAWGFACALLLRLISRRKRD